MRHSSETALEKILHLLERHTATDFTLYKPATLRRRLERRMAARKLKSLQGYADYLGNHPQEVLALFEDILIQVTHFFRDPQVFKVIERSCLGPLCATKKTEEPIRIWVPACSTGEEVYSFAIVLADLMATRNKPHPVQIFGTDISDTALAKARAGVFGETIRTHISGARLKRYFEPVSGGFKVRKAIRDMCIFARHDLIGDPPFSNLDLVSCRNLLIYFTPALQEQVIPLFHFALKDRGDLLLGAAETISSFPHLFEVKDKAARLFRRKAGTSKALPKSRSPGLRFAVPPQIQPSTHRPIARSLPPSELKASVETILQKTIGLGSEQPVLLPLPLPNSQEKVYLVLTDSKPAEKATAPANGTKKKRGSAPAEDSAEVTKLRRQLKTAQETLHEAVEQAEATNEELRAANEEIVSSNEELQSTNEELETAKEELQSANEELAAVNAELEGRNSDLERANLVFSRFRAIVESSDDAIISKDLNGVIQTWNEGAEKMYGYKAEEVIGKSVAILIPADRPNEEPAILAELAEGRKIDHYETIRRHKSGALLNVSISVSPIRNAAGQIIGASKIARDITARKRAEAEVQEAREQAEKANRAKDDFLAALSHELRTPLTPVLLVSSDGAKNEKLVPEVRSDFEMIRSNVELEVRLIDDLLDLSRITAGKLRMELQAIDAHPVLVNAIAMVRPEAERKGIVLTEKFTPSRAVVMADSVRLHQIFWNLLKNAAKFTAAKGTVAVEERCSGGFYVVTVSDTGIGMTKEELERAFDAFSQGSHAREAGNSFGGLGLGLTISKRLVAFHGGTISGESKGRGHGCVFTVKIPLVLTGAVHSEKGSSPTKKDGGVRNRRLLLVEDNHPTRTALTRLLANRGYNVASASTKAEALQRAALQGFDVVVSDIGLPDGDGYSLFEELRKIQPELRGIALTGYGMQEDRVNSHNSGFHVHLTKPVEVQALERALSTL